MFRTERLYNTLNPKFERAMRIMYVKAISDIGKEPQVIRTTRACASVKRGLPYGKRGLLT